MRELKLLDSSTIPKIFPSTSALQIVESEWIWLESLLLTPVPCNHILHWTLKQSVKIYVWERCQKAFRNKPNYPTKAILYSGINLFLKTVFKYSIINRLSENGLDLLTYGLNILNFLIKTVFSLSHTQTHTDTHRHTHTHFLVKKNEGIRKEIHTPPPYLYPYPLFSTLVGDIYPKPSLPLAH